MCPIHLRRRPVSAPARAKRAAPPSNSRGRKGATGSQLPNVLPGIGRPKKGKIRVGRTADSSTKWKGEGDRRSASTPGREEAAGGLVSPAPSACGDESPARKVEVRDLRSRPRRSRRKCAASTSPQSRGFCEKLAGQTDNSSPQIEKGGCQNEEKREKKSTKENRSHVEEEEDQDGGSNKAQSCTSYDDLIIDDDEPIRGDIFPDCEIPAHNEFLADPAHDYWTWDTKKLAWFHVDEETKEVIYAPEDFD
jgi:hypothetical protein